MNPAPIALFVFNRPIHTRRVVDALQKNELACDSDLYVFADGPRRPEDQAAVAEVRNFIRGVSGFRSVSLIERDENLGCAKAIIRGITEIINKFGQIIVVEDDIVTSRYFLRFMNEALELYRDEDRVACIHGYLYPVTVQLPESFFIRGADIWGWATWKRAWELYEFNSQKLQDELKSMNMPRELRPYIRLLKQQIAGKIDTWDIQWCASAFLRNKLTLYPGKSLAKNIGHDSSGTHCRTNDLYSVELSEAPVILSRIAIEENPAARKAIGDFLKTTNPGILRKLLSKSRKLIWKDNSS